MKNIYIQFSRMVCKKGVVNIYSMFEFLIFILVLFIGGRHKTSGYVQYVPVILADVPARTTFIEITIAIGVRART